MKKLIVLFLAILLGLAFVYFSSLKESANTLNKTVDHSDFSETFLKDCRPYSPKNNDFTYKNSSTGLNLDYPKDTVVCEKRSSFEESGLDVMVWNKSDFDEGIPALPLAIIYFDNSLVDNLQQPITISSEKILIGSETVTVNTVKAPECTNDSCLTYQTTSFTKNGHNIKIELLTGTISWNNFSFE